MSSLSAVIAAYNEVDNIEYVVLSTHDVLQENITDFEILIIDDGSTDGTDEVARRLASTNGHIRVIHHGQNRGFGAALITGYANASGELVAPLPADGQIPPSELMKFLALIDDFDMVIGVRAKRHYNGYRKLLHGGMGGLTALLFGRNLPPSAGSCMFKREVFQDVKLVSTSGFANSEFAIKAQRCGYRLGTIQIETVPRLSGHSKVSNVPTIIITFEDMIKSRRSL